MAAKPPTPSLAPGVPPSGNGKFIVIALLLLLIVGGIVAWRFLLTPPDPVTVKFDAGPPPPPPSTRNPDDDIPPPPPTEDAGKEDAGKKVVIVQGGNGCDAKKCTGTSSDEMSTALAFRAKQAHRCYDNALAQDATLRGKVSIAVRIGSNGAACSAGVASNDMGGNTSVASCVAGYFKSGGFPAPKGGCVDVNVPINFVPRQ